MADGPDFAGVVLAGRYRLGRLLGVGGMARVVEAHDDRLDRRVAVKLVSASKIDDTERRRFLDEARAGASFVHPHAVGVYDAGADNGWLYLVMEVVDGPTLAEVIAERGPLPAVEAIRIIDGVLDALAAAHAVGLVHRDVKPGNVLLGPEGAVKLADFGIAKRLDHGHDDLTVAGQFIGTPRYLAPEQLAGERATPSSDVYGVGIVLFELLSGRPPFDGESLLAIALAHRDRPVPALPADTPPGLAEVVLRSLAKQPDDRFPDAAAMQTALRQVPIAPAPAPPIGPPVAPTRVAPTPIRPALRRDRTRRLWVALAVATMAALLAGLTLRACADDEQLLPPAGTAAGSTTVALVTTSVPVSSTVAPTPPPPVLPTTVADLIAALRVAGTGFGEAGPDLLAELEELEGLDGNKERDAAADIREDVVEWRDDGRLDPVFAEQVLAIVTPLADESGDDDDDRGGGNGRGNGNGNGNGNGRGND